MDGIRRPARWATAVGLLAAIGGLAVLFLYALSEVLADPTISLADAFDIGRLPWTTIGVDLTVGGATLSALAGVLAAWLSGGTIRRLITGLLFAVVAFWWFVALLPQPGGAPCAACRPRGPEPLTVAYSNPKQTVLLLIAPAAVIGVLALTAHRSRMRPVESPPV